MRCENCGSQKIYTDDEPCIEDIGRLADSVDNMLVAVSIPGLPAESKLAAMKEALAEWRGRLRKSYVRLSGDDPWSTHPPSSENTGNDRP